jgi:RNA polymerase-binding transcription factor DksA
MNKKDLEYFKTQLLKRKKQLEEDIANLEEKFSVSQRDSTSELSIQPIHLADLASDSQIREKEAYFVNSFVEELQKVNEALQKIYSNTYGICEKCGEKIEIERLKALLYTNVCIKCGRKL